jgi:membrane-bound lytic murein transglycosylase A
MCTQLLGLLFSLPSGLAVAVAVTTVADARRAPPAPSHAVHAEVPRGPAPAATGLAQSGPLKIPHAVLEPADWGDLDGWAGDDHASAFATFYASCRPIVHAIALRAEFAKSRVALIPPAPPPPAGDARNRLQPHSQAGEARRRHPPPGDARDRPGPHRQAGEARGRLGPRPSAGDARDRPGPRPPAGDERKRLAHGQTAGQGRNNSTHPQPTAHVRPIQAALEEVCVRAIKAGRLKSEVARQFFETNFVPARIHRLGDAAGFITGYYEPIVEGSRFPTGEFNVPLYRRPRDLVAPGIPDGGPFPNTGRAFRRTATGELVPYYDRGEIEDGALDGQHLEICWLRTAAEALTIQIEGSARVRLEDGTILRISYDAHNGYPFVPVGRALIERNLVQRSEMSTERIREWMRDNPEGAKEIHRHNRSVVFFRIVGLDHDTEAIGAQGIPLSPGRSIAVDKGLHVFGTPFFIEAELPLASPLGQSSFRRIMIAQDTGSAIVGPARADLYFGAGDHAGQVAQRIRHNGRFTILLPRELNSLVAAAHIPLPPEKPRLSQVAGRALHPSANQARSEEPARVATATNEREKTRRPHVLPVSYRPMRGELAQRVQQANAPRWP